MNVLFIHNNFPAQYQHIARTLARDPHVRIFAIGSSTSQRMQNVTLLKYGLPSLDVSATHPFARRFDVECHRAEQVIYTLSSLASLNFVPDIIMAHPGWGETLPLRALFRSARIILYCEFFYGVEGRDVGFDPEFPETGDDGRVGLHLKNASTLLALAECDLGVSPTNWQRSTFPQEYQPKISVIHEGIDIDTVKPNHDAAFRLSPTAELHRSDEVVTFVARNLEPLRGYHVFMRALPRIMEKRPRAQILIIGGHGASYGASPAQGTTWKSIFFDEISNKVDHSRIHFVGRLTYTDYVRALQVSSAHIYLTYPFVLSWSLLEAMSVGCLVIASDTAPVREVLNNNNGLLVPFFDVEQLSNRVVDALANPHRFQSIRAAARQTIADHYDMNRICVPKAIELIKTSI
jgi:glycosyltransferase involved in cell wall biosynthesis